MSFDPNAHLRTLKGQQYLDVKWRLVWLREEHPEATITTEMVHLDREEKLAVFRAEVSIPEKGSATGYGSETERDFPLGWIEKAETKALGRALAALGFGTQFAQELDEGDGIVGTPAPSAKTPPRTDKPSTQKVEAPDDEATLRQKIRDAAISLGKEPPQTFAAVCALAKELAVTVPSHPDGLTTAWLRGFLKRLEKEVTAIEPYYDTIAAMATAQELEPLPRAIEDDRDLSDVGREVLLMTVNLAHDAMRAERASQLAQIEVRAAEARKQFVLGTGGYAVVRTITQRRREELLQKVGVPS